MTRISTVRCGVLTVAMLSVLAAGCASQDAITQLGDGIQAQFKQKGDRIEQTFQNIGKALSDSAARSQARYEQLRDSLISTYKEQHKPARLVFFSEDGAGPARVTEAERRRLEGVPALPPKKIESNLLTERTLEHRGLRLLWNLPLDGSGVAHADVSDGYLYLVTKAHRIYSVDLLKGLTRWIYELPRRPDSPPGFNESYVVISAGDRIHVIDKLAGRATWRFDTAIQPASRPFCDANYFVYGGWDGQVAGFEFGDRHPKWRFKAGDRVFAAPYYRAGSTLAAVDEGLLVTYNVVARLSGRETRLGGRPVGDLVGAKDSVFIGTANFEMIAIKAADGSKIWAHGSGGRVMAGPWLSPAGDVLYYAARDDGLYALTAATGKQRWKAPGGVRPIAAHRGHLFLLLAAGSVAKVDVGTGQAVWTEPAAPFVTAVAILTNEIMYLISEDGQIFAVAPKK